MIQITKKDNAKKILVIGLDNAGKSTILELIQNKMVDLVSIQPTRGLSRKEAEILGKQLVIHDLGGQNSYRKMYLTQAKYFVSTNAYVFVVDLQDPKRYGLALEYFKKSVKLMSKLGIFPKLFILFHKHDKKFLVEYNEEHSQVREAVDSLQSKFSDIASKFKFTIHGMFKTSVYNVWSCYSAFHEIWTSIHLKLSNVQDYLTKIFDDIPNVQIALLLDHKADLVAKKLSRFTGGGNRSEVIPYDRLVDISGKSINLMHEWAKSGLYDQEEELNSATMKIKDDTVLVHRFSSEGRDFYLVILMKGGEYTGIQGKLQKISFSLSVFLSENRES